ncbi:MAG: putative metal-binding motif-containing protein [Polyangiales bacterium]
MRSRLASLSALVALAGCDGTVPVAIPDRPARDATIDVVDSGSSARDGGPADSGPSCGTVDAACCAGNLCAGALVCEANVCRMQPNCGADTQPCCIGSSCRSGLVCQTGTCRAATACGMRAQPCCSGACEAGLRCVAERCDPCGTLGQACCGGGTCGPSLTCQSDRCQPCGGNGQPCCGAACAPGTECTAGTCRGIDRDMDGALAGVDCDDNDPRRAPGMRERCDNIDNDCSGVADDRNACGLWQFNGSTGSWSTFALDAMADAGAPSPNAPASAIRFALDIESLRIAYVFTNTTYHVLDAQTRQWTASGSRATLIPQLAGADAFVGYTIPAGHGGGDPNLESAAILTTGGVINVQFDIAARRFTFRQTDPVPMWMPPGPTYTSVRAAWLDVTNAYGWVTTAPSSLCATGPMMTGPYAGAISGDRVHIFEAGSCFVWAPTVPFATFAPFARPNAPPLARIATTFYQNGSLFVLGTM